MKIDVLKYISSFFLLILVQVLLINHVHISGYINPYLYVLFILMLPFETPVWLVLILSFFLGLGVDIFSDSIGMHAAAATFTGYCRPMILGIIKPRDGYEFTNKPNIKDMGFMWYVTYAAILIFLHHLVYFYIEIFRFIEFFGIFLRVTLSTLFTLLLVIITQILFTKHAKDI